MRELWSVVWKVTVGCGTVVSIVAGIVSVIAFQHGGPEAVAQTWTVIVQAPTVVNEITNNIDISEMVDQIKRLVEIAERLCRMQGC